MQLYFDLLQKRIKIFKINLNLKIILKVIKNGVKSFETIFYNFLFFLKILIKRIKINLNLKILIKIFKINLNLKILIKIFKINLNPKN